MRKNRLGLLSPAKETVFILDTGGKIEVDFEYSRLGSSEGWLEYLGSYRDHKDTLCHTYRLKGEG